MRLDTHADCTAGDAVADCSADPHSNAGADTQRNADCDTGRNPYPDARCHLDHHVLKRTALLAFPCCTEPLPV